MFKALASGLIGAVVLNVLHESARQVSDKAPRVDLLGQQAVANTYEFVGAQTPEKDNLYWITLAGDLTSNALFYSFVATAGSEKAVLKGALLGAGAGLGAVYLPDKIGLKKKYVAKTAERAAMTFAWYFIGGVAAGVAYKLLSENPK